MKYNRCRAAGLVFVVGVALVAFSARREPPRRLRKGPAPSTRCWSGIRSLSIRSSRRIRRTLPVSGLGRSYTRRSSMRTTASNSATHQYSLFTMTAPHGASRRAAVIAAAYTALVGLFPTRQTDLDARYAASLASADRQVRER